MECLVPAAELEEARAVAWATARSAEGRAVEWVESTEVVLRAAAAMAAVARVVAVRAAATAVAGSEAAKVEELVAENCERESKALWSPLKAGGLLGGELLGGVPSDRWRGFSTLSRLRSTMTST